jgi:hypothetical protein
MKVYRFKGSVVAAAVAEVAADPAAAGDIAAVKALTAELNAAKADGLPELVSADD